MELLTASRPECREYLWQHYVLGLDYAEIAEALSVPLGTVKSRIARGRRMLLERLGNRDALGERPTKQEPSGPAGSEPVADRSPLTDP